MPHTRFQGSLVAAYAIQISSAFEILNVFVSDSEVEDIAFFLTRAMGSESRDYHRAEHSLDVAFDLAPVARLAGLFHDVIYTQVDPSWRTSLSDILYPFVLSDHLHLDVVTSLNKSEDKWDKITAIVFGLQSEAGLVPGRGLNEFLSAVVFIRKLKPYLSDENLLKGIACIECTIPFRKVDEHGLTPAVRLGTRLQEALLLLSIQKSDSTIIDETISECRAIVERDLASFGSATPAEYLSDTWRVIFENNASLRNTYYSIIEYRQALVGTLSFLNGLDPSFLFWVEEKCPTPNQIVLRDKAKYNLLVAVEYLRAQIFSTVVLEAIAIETGGDAPYELFVGPKKRSREHNPNTIDKNLSFLSINSSDSLSATVLSLLLDGRGHRSKFDSKDSRLAGYFYSHLYQRSAELWQISTLFISNKMGAMDVLKKIPISILDPVLGALITTTVTRDRAITNLRKRVAKA